jgi:hypothetical protein
MIEFGRVKHVEPVYKSAYQAQTRNSPRHDSDLFVDPDFGVIVITDDSGNETGEEIGFHLSEGVLPVLDDENNIDFLNADLSTQQLGTDLAPKSVKVGQEVAFIKQDGFSDIILAEGQPQRVVQFAHKAGPWMLAEQYRYAIQAQLSGSEIPTEYEA